RTLQCKTETFYNRYGLVTETDEYDCGSGAPPASPTRKTLIAYASLGNGIVDRPATITVCTGSGTSSSCGGTGTQVAQITFTYDEGTPTAPSGTTPQHVAISGSRGNVTTITYQTQGSSTISQTFTYYDTGNVQRATDVNGAQTT